MTLPTAIVCDQAYKRHQPGPRHPECPERIDAVTAGIADLSPERLLRLDPSPASEEDIQLCHTAEYIEQVKRDVSDGIGCLSTGDTDICEESLEIALLAAGGVRDAVDSVCEGRARNAFCAVRPPGHHATRDAGMGFCIFNNVAIGARHAQQKHGVERVLVADWDVHHGNGTQDIFYEDPSVLFFSTHQFPCYPGTGRVHERGAGSGKGTTINCPVAAGSGGTEIVGAFRDKLIPVVKKFRPELVMISAGFDARVGDPIGGLMLRDADFAELTGMLMDVAAMHAGGRVVSVLEGGYNLKGLASAVGAHVKELALRDGIRPAESR
ncbi:MAG: histone deacetylase [Lentisphaerae bacterium]|nr:histone deacetylase [Lentisphaerota bacterium]